MREAQCPKCGGSNYYYAKRNLSGAIFVVLRTKETPICKDCGEITNLVTPPISKKVKLSYLTGIAFVILFNNIRPDTFGDLDQLIVFGVNYGFLAIGILYLIFRKAKLNRK